MGIFNKNKEIDKHFTGLQEKHTVISFY